MRRQNPMGGQRVATQGLGLKSSGLQKGLFLHEKRKYVPEIWGKRESHLLPDFVLHLQLSRPMNGIVCASPQRLYAENPNSRLKSESINIPARLADNDNSSLDGCGI